MLSSLSRIPTAISSAMPTANFVTDSAGTFTITDIAPGTTLIIKETRAKDGYILDDTPQTVKVKSNEVVTVEFRNQPKGNLSSS